MGDDFHVVTAPHPFGFAMFAVAVTPARPFVFLAVSVFFGLVRLGAVWRVALVGAWHDVAVKVGHTPHAQLAALFVSCRHP